MKPNNMNIWIATIDEPLFYGPLYSAIVQRHPNQIKGIILLPPAKQPLNESWYYIRFWGLIAFLKISIMYVFKTFFGQHNLRKDAKRYDIPIYTFSKIKDAQSLLAAQTPDVILSNVPDLVKPKLLNLAKKFWLNTHCSPLPSYGGMNAPFWMMFNQEKELAISIHIMDRKFDTGEVLSLTTVKNNKPYFELLFDLYRHASREHIKLIESNYDYRSLPPTTYIASYLGKPPAKLGKQFRKEGGRFI